MDDFVITKNNPMYRYLIVLTISSTVGLQAWLTLFNNFAVDVAGLKGHHVGMIQSIREIPGFLALLAVFVIIFIKESRLSALSIFILGLGVAMTGLFPSYLGLILTTLIMSFGFHYYETTNMSLTLQYFDKHTSPLVFGKLRSISAASSIVVGVFIFAMAAVLEEAEARKVRVHRISQGSGASKRTQGQSHSIIGGPRGAESTLRRRDTVVLHQLRRRCAGSGHWSRR